jgi:hypothetical protein
MCPSRDADGRDAVRGWLNGYAQARRDARHVSDGAVSCLGRRRRVGAGRAPAAGLLGAQGYGQGAAPWRAGSDAPADGPGARGFPSPWPGGIRRGGRTGRTPSAERRANLSVAGTAPGPAADWEPARASAQGWGEDWARAPARPGWPSSWSSRANVGRSTSYTSATTAPAPPPRAPERAPGRRARTRAASRPARRRTQPRGASGSARPPTGSRRRTRASYRASDRGDERVEREAAPGALGLGVRHSLFGLKIEFASSALRGAFHTARRTKRFAKLSPRSVEPFRFWFFGSSQFMVGSAKSRS